MTGPLVSVVIPAFNNRDYICQAVDSVLAQSYPNIEIIVVDDGSTDDTWSLLSQTYGSRISYIYQTNCGPSSARNRGLQEAKGHYIQFLDADDLIAENKIELQVEHLGRKTGYTVAYSDFAYFVDGAFDKLIPSQARFKAKYISGDLWLPLLDGNFIVSHAPLSVTDVIRDVGGFNVTLTAAEDYDLWLRIARSGQRFLFLDECLAFYRRRAESRSSDWIEEGKSTLFIMNAIIGSDPLRTREERNVYLHHIARLQQAIGVGEWRQGRRREIVSRWLQIVRVDRKRAGIMILQLLNLWPLRDARGG